MTATTRRPNTAERHRRYAEDMDSAARHLVGLRAMLNIARAHGMEYHADRLAAELADYEADLTDTMEAAIEDGFGPEDFDA